MLLLVTILKSYKDVEDLMLGFVEFEIKGSTVIKGEGMGSILSQQPLLTTLDTLFPNADRSSYTVLSVGSRARINECMEWARTQFNLENKQGSGMMFTIDVDSVLGLAENLSSDRE